jgi:lysozyme
MPTVPNDELQPPEADANTMIAAGILHDQEQQRIAQMPAEHGLDDKYVTSIKSFEGYSERPQWDYHQWSSGYGTRASGPTDIQPREVLERRFKTELTKASYAVDQAFPNLPEGPRAALTDLTYNAGAGWMRQGLARSVAAGDWKSAQKQIQQYVNAGGQRLQGLVNRRSVTATWFTDAPEYRTEPLQLARGADGTAASIPGGAQATFSQATTARQMSSKADPGAFGETEEVPVWQPRKLDVPELRKRRAYSA